MRQLAFVRKSRRPRYRYNVLAAVPCYRYNNNTYTAVCGASSLGELGNIGQSWSVRGRVRSHRNREQAIFLALRCTHIIHVITILYTIYIVWYIYILSTRDGERVRPSSLPHANARDIMYRRKRILCIIIYILYMYTVRCVQARTIDRMPPSSR